MTLAQLRKRITDSIKESGKIDDKAALKRLLSLVHYVQGNYNDVEAFKALKKALGRAKCVSHYLALPPVLFETVINGLDAAGLAQGSRVTVEKPYGRYLAAGSDMNRVATSAFPGDSTLFIAPFTGPE